VESSDLNIKNINSQIDLLVHKHQLAVAAKCG
jgi:hypothetical protein